MDDSDIRDLLDELNKQCEFYKPSQNCNLDENKIAEYRTKFPKEYDQILFDHIIKLTRYIDYETFYTKLIEIVQKIQDEVYIYINPYDPCHSETWCVVLAWPFIKDKVKCVFTDLTKIDEKYPVLIIDDAIYTGLRMAGFISNIMDYSPCKKIIVCVPYATITYEGVVKYHLKEYKEIAQIEYYVGESIWSIRFEPHTDDMVFYLADTFDTSGIGLPIYFQHKIAGKESTFKNIYNNCVIEIPDRKCLSFLDKLNAIA